ncbi:hypothetical protein [Polynucleobacter sp. AP-Nino-20-G2]|nr:hypothetical protein [Polynucleobacter sp. AP-Nino-20-G2]
MTIQNRSAGIAEGLYFLKNQYERELTRISNLEHTPKAGEA